MGWRRSSSAQRKRAVGHHCLLRRAGGQRRVPVLGSGSSDQTCAEFVQISCTTLTTHPDDFGWNNDRAPAVTRLANGDMIIAVAFAEHQTVARFHYPLQRQRTGTRQGFSLRLLLPADKHDIDGELSRKIVNDDMAIAYRFFNPVNGQYLYAADSQEIHDLQARLPTATTVRGAVSLYRAAADQVGKVESTLRPAWLYIAVNQHTGAVLLSADATEQASIASQYPAGTIRVFSAISTPTRHTPGICRFPAGQSSKQQLSIYPIQHWPERRACQCRLA